MSTKGCPRPDGPPCTFLAKSDISGLQSDTPSTICPNSVTIRSVDAGVEPVPVPRLHGRLEAEEDRRRRRDGIRSVGESDRQG